MRSKILGIQKLIKHDGTEDDDDIKTGVRKWNEGTVETANL